MSENNSEEENNKKESINSTETVSDNNESVAGTHDENTEKVKENLSSESVTSGDKENLSNDKSIDDELEKNKKEIEAMIASAKNNDFKFEKNLDLSFAPKAGMRPIDIPRADGSLPGEPLKSSSSLNDIPSQNTTAENVSPKSLVPEYNLSFDENLTSPFTDEEMTFIKEKKMVYVTTGTPDDIAAKKDTIDTYIGRRRIAYKKAVPFFQRNKKVVAFFGVLGAAILLVAIIAFTFRKSIANFYLDNYITSNQIPIKSFNVVEFNSDEVNLTNVMSSDGRWEMGSFKMLYNSKELSEGYINKIEIKDFKSKYVTIFDLLQGQGFRNITNGKQATVGSIKVNGTTTLDYAKITFSSASMSLRNDRIDATIPVTVESDLVNFKGKLKFAGNYQEANLVLELEDGKFKKFHNIEPKITGGSFVFKKSKERIENIETNITTKINDKTTWYLNAKSTPSPTKGIDISVEYKIDHKISDNDRRITTIKAASRSAVLTGSPFAFKGNLPLKLSISGYKDGTVNLNNITANLDGTISCIKHKCDYTLSKQAPSKMGMDSMSISLPKHRIAFEESPTNITITPENSPFISVKDNNAIEYAFNINEILLKGQYASGMTIKSFESDLGLANVKGVFNPVDLTNETNITTDGGYYNDNAFGIGGLHTSASFKSASLPVIKANSDEIHFYGKEKLLPVFSGELDMSPEGVDNYDYKILMQSLNRDMVINIAGKYNVTEDTGDYVLNIPKIVFTDGGAQLANISPDYARYITRLNGSVTVKSVGKINNGSYDGTIKLLIENASFNWGSVKINNLNGVLGFKSFYPLVTDGEQLLYASAVDIGYPLYDNTVSFRINGNDRIIVDRISSTFADGTLLLKEKSFIPFSLSGGVLNIELKNMDLPELVNSMKISNLTLNGKAEGKFQLYISRGFVYTEGSIETTDKGGLLKYNFDDYEFEDEETRTQMQPLKDFSYDHIVAKIKGRPGNNYNVDLELEGINPEVNTDGVGSSVKIDLQSDLSKLIKTKPVLTPISDDVLKAMKSF